MIVFGDRCSEREPAELMDTLRARLEVVGRAPAGVERHAALVALLITSGALAQGLADLAFERAGADVPDAEAEAAMSLTLALAEAVWRSHVRGHRGALELRRARAVLEAMRRAPAPRRVRIVDPEGFKHYGLYPRRTRWRRAGCRRASVRSWSASGR
jgi:hypothetical protein